MLICSLSFQQSEWSVALCITYAHGALLCLLSMLSKSLALVSLILCVLVFVCYCIICGNFSFLCVCVCFCKDIYVRPCLCVKLKLCVRSLFACKFYVQSLLSFCNISVLCVQYLLSYLYVYAPVVLLHLIFSFTYGYLVVLSF